MVAAANADKPNFVATPMKLTYKCKYTIVLGVCATLSAAGTLNVIETRFLRIWSDPGDVVHFSTAVPSRKPLSGICTQVPVFSS